MEPKHIRLEVVKKHVITSRTLIYKIKPIEFPVIFENDDLRALNFYNIDKTRRISLYIHT